MTIGEAKRRNVRCKCGCLFSEHDYVGLSIIPCKHCGYIKKLFKKCRIVCSSFYPITNLEYLEQRYESLTTT